MTKSLASRRINYEQLTHAGQLRRLRQLAALAIARYPLTTEQLKAIHHGENTTFELSALPTDHDAIPAASAHHLPNRYLVRVHRQGYNSDAAILSELQWLEALHQEGLPVQRPVSNLEGQALTVIDEPTLKVKRTCSILRWNNGRFASKPTPKHFERIGRLTAQLHQHAQRWTLPDGFERRDLSAEQFLSSMLRHDPEQLMRSELDAAQRGRVDWAIAQINACLEEIGQAPARRGLIHSDLHFGNVVFEGDIARPLDFDDACFAPYLYDVATTLGTWRRSNLYPDFLSAYRRGYEQFLAWPEDAQTHLPTLELMRLVIMLLWTLDRAVDTPRFIEQKPKILQRAIARIEEARHAALSNKPSM